MLEKSVRAKELRTERFASGLCVMCGKTKHLPNKQKCQKCSDQMRTYPVRRSDDSIEQRRNYNRRYTLIKSSNRRESCLCISCGRGEGKHKGYCDNCYDRCQKANAVVRKTLREDAFAAYGGCICACCNETKAPCFFQIDHINGDGYKHKSDNGKYRLKGVNLYRWLQKNNYPPGFQVLCADCNFAKGNEVECPHKQETRSMLAKIAMLPLTY